MVPGRKICTTTSAVRASARNACWAEVSDIVHGAGGRREVITATAWDCPFDGGRAAAPFPSVTRLDLNPSP